MDPQEVVATGEVAAGEMSDCLGKVDAVLESTATLESSAWQFCDLQQSWQACDGGILEDKVPKRYDGREVHCVCLGSMESLISQCRHRGRRCVRYICLSLWVDKDHRAVFDQHAVSRGIGRVARCHINGGQAGTRPERSAIFVRKVVVREFLVIPDLRDTCGNGDLLQSGLHEALPLDGLETTGQGDVLQGRASLEGGDAD